MSFLDPRVWGALVLALVIGGAGGYWRGDVAGAAGVQVKWDAESLARSETNGKAVLAAVAANDAAHEVDVAQSKKVIANYEQTIDIKNAAITAARADADRQRLRIDRSAVCGSPASAGQAASPVIADGAGVAATVDLPAETERRLRDIAEEDDREIARKDAKIGALQQWAVDHGFYGDMSGVGR